MQLATSRLLIIFLLKFDHTIEHVLNQWTKFGNLKNFVLPANLGALKNFSACHFDK